MTAFAFSVCPNGKLFRKGFIGKKRISISKYFPLMLWTFYGLEIIKNVILLKLN